jgi:hypothetical protein
MQPMTTFEAFSFGLQVVVGLAAFVTLWFLYRQHRVMQEQLVAMQETTKAQSALSLVGFLQSSDVRAARQCVREVLSKKPVEEWSPQERQSAAMVCANYDVAAGLLRAQLAPASLIVNNWGPSIRHCHSVLEPYISELRQGSGGHASYWSNFDWLCAEAKRSESSPSQTTA